MAKRKYRRKSVKRRRASPIPGEARQALADFKAQMKTFSCDQLRETVPKIHSEVPELRALKTSNEPGARALYAQAKRAVNAAAKRCALPRSLMGSAFKRR